MRRQPLAIRQVGIGLVVFGGERNKQAAGHGEAAGNRRDQADDEDEPVAHLIGDAQTPRQKLKPLQCESDGRQHNEHGAYFEIVA